MNSELNNAKKCRKIGIQTIIQGEKGREFPPETLKEYPLKSIDPEELKKYIKENPDNVVDIKLDTNKKEVVLNNNKQAEVEGK